MCVLGRIFCINSFRDASCRLCLLLSRGRVIGVCVSLCVCGHTVHFRFMIIPHNVKDHHSENLYTFPAGQ